MNQTELAKALGYTFQQVQKYEDGRNRVSASRLWQIAEALGVSPDYFFADLPGEDAKTENAPRWETDMEALILVRNYYAIRSPKVRRCFLEMVKAAAEP
jgi:transcriptional regulator with XRE-family HTH domain